MENKKSRLSLWVFAIYMLLLVWLILFKLSVDFGDMVSVRSINTVPFGMPLMVNGKPDYSEVMFNVLVFVPLGVYLKLFKPDMHPLIALVLCFAASFSFEVLQYAFAIGRSDVTDLISNTSGGLCGILFYYGFRAVFKDRAEKVINGLGIIIEICSLALIAFLFMAEG